MFNIKQNFQSTDAINDALEAQGMTKIGDHLSGVTRTLVAKTNDFAVYALGSFGTPGMLYSHAFNVEFKEDGKTKLANFDHQADVEEFLESLYTNKSTGE